MLAKRIIPTLLFRGDQLVKGEKFNGWRSVGHVRQAIEIHAARGVDELIALDIGATPEGRGPNFAQIEQMTNIGYTPITIGGGVTSIADVMALLRAGADKVAIGTNAGISNIVRNAADVVGSQAIVVSCDVVEMQSEVRGNRCVIEVAAERCAWFARCGAGEILLTSIDREGTMEGYDLDLITSVAAAVDIPVIAHGGCSGPEDMLKAIRRGASAVAAGALFQFTDHTPASCAKYLHDHGVEVRI